MDKMIAILLPTYNSEKYLQEQINSLVLQSYSNWHLWVRDDGSNDRTLSILYDIQRQLENRMTIIADNKGKLGACKSFESLIECCSTEYVMFCDHDDIWLPTKIEDTLQVMIDTELKYINIPILVCTDLLVVDKDLNVINSSMWNYSRNRPTDTSNIYDLAVSNYATGCTIMINKLAIECSLPFNQKAFMHDWWIALNVCKNGVIIALKQSTILYRQHEDNIFGTQIVDKNYFGNRILSFRNSLKNNMTIYNMVKTVYPHLNPLRYIFAKIKVVLRKMFFKNINFLW